MRRPRVVLAVAVTGLLLTACASDSDADQEPQGAGVASPAASATPTPTAAAVDPASVDANELGEVPVMMYHQVKDDPKGEYDQTPEEFRAELQRLYDADYRPITTAAFVTGSFDLPAGMHPVVMTFDDGTTSLAQIGPDGQPTPETALGIMEAFEDENPDWDSTGSFYVNSNPFSDDAVLPWLVENGYEVGVHTVTHEYLNRVSDATVQEEIGQNIADIRAAAPGVEVTTMALPFGLFPENRALIESGTYDGETYELAGVLEVGSDPMYSPFDARFTPFAIDRIRSGLGEVDSDSNYWLDILDDSPERVFTSDGDPNTVSYPADSEVEVAASWESKASQY